MQVAKRWSEGYLCPRAPAGYPLAPADERGASLGQHPPRRRGRVFPPRYLIDIDQLAMVLLPLNLGKVGMRERMQLAKLPF